MLTPVLRTVLTPVLSFLSSDSLLIYYLRDLTLIATASEATTLYGGIEMCVSLK